MPAVHCLQILNPAGMLPNADALRAAPRFVAAALLLLTMGCGGNEESQERAAEPMAPRSSPVAAVALEPRDLSRRVDLVATVMPLRSIRVPGRISAMLREVLVEEGDAVAAGAVIARFDVAEQQAELARAEAQADFARTQLASMEQLRSANTVSRNELDQARVALAVAEAERDLWQTRVGFGVVRAPQAGVISARHVEPGESVPAQEVLVELAVMDRLLLRPQVSEMDVVHLQPGQNAIVRIDALPELDLEARITRIFPAADGDSRLVPVELELGADAAERGVRPGFLARVRLLVDRREDVLAVPASAIGMGAAPEPGASGHYVYVIENERLRQRSVTTGVTRGQWTEIVSGLAPGEVVLASNPIDMRPDSRVRIVDWRS